MGGPVHGRQAELGLLDDAFNAARIRGAGQFVALFGEPGIGKTRLSLEFERVVRPDAIVLRGRCRLYDEGIPYRPFQEIIEGAAGSAAPDEWLMSIGVGQEVRDVILTMLGRGQERTGGQTHWAIGRVMAAMTQRFPAVIIVNDVQHASPEVLDLLEALAEPLRGMPVMMICLARPELLPGPLVSGWRSAKTLTLQPLGEAEIRLLLAQLIPEGADGATADYRPRPGTSWSPPQPGIRCFLTARPASPGKARRPDVIPACGARVARVPARPASPGRADAPRAWGRRGGSVPPGVDRGRSWPGKISRGQRIRPGPGTGCIDQAGSRRPGCRGGLGGRSAVGFRHRLIREAAYAMLTRADRARLHEQHADWLSQLTPPEPAGPARQASHLEQAHEHLLAIGDPGRRAAAIAARAGRLLTDAARQAHRSGELAAETGFLDRAGRMLGPESAAGAELLPSSPPPRRGGNVRPRGGRRRVGASEGARLGFPAVRWRSAVELERTRLYTEPDAVDTGASLDVVRQASEIFTLLGDDLGLARAHYLHAELLWMNGEPDSAVEHCEQQVRHATRIAAGFEVAAGQTYIAWSLVDGCTPVQQGLLRLT